MEEKRKYHKFDLFNDTCLICGVQKRNKPYVADGYNPNFTNRQITEYSTNGIHFSNEFINCKQNKNGK